MLVKNNFPKGQGCQCIMCSIGIDIDLDHCGITFQISNPVHCLIIGLDTYICISSHN